MDFRQGVIGQLTVTQNTPIASVPAVPQLCRMFGREGIAIVRVHNMRGFDYGVLAPDGTFFIAWCGWMTESETAFRDHLRVHACCRCAYGAEGSRDPITYRGETPAYEVLPVANHLVTWANEQYSGVNPREYDHPDEGLHCGFPGGFDPANRNHRPVVGDFDGRWVVPLPNEMRRVGLSGIYIVRIPGLSGPRFRNGPYYGIVMPPRVAVVRWCGFIHSNWFSLANHTRCDCCSGRNSVQGVQTPSMPAHLRGNVVPIVQGYSDERANWMNLVIRREMSFRANGGGYPSNLVGIPPMPPVDPAAVAGWIAGGGGGGGGAGGGGADGVDMDVLQGNMDRLRAENARLGRDNLRLRQERGRLLARVDDLEKEVGRLEKEVDRLKDELDDEVKDYNKLGRRYDRLCDRYDELLKKHDDQSKMLGRMKDDYDKMRKGWDDVAKERDDAVEDRNKLASQLQSSEEARGCLQEENNRLRGELEELKKRNEVVEEANQSLRAQTAGPRTRSGNDLAGALNRSVIAELEKDVRKEKARRKRELEELNESFKEKEAELQKLRLWHSRLRPGAIDANEVDRVRLKEKLDVVEEQLKACQQELEAEKKKREDEKKKHDNERKTLIDQFEAERAEQAAGAGGEQEHLSADDAINEPSTVTPERGAMSMLFNRYPGNWNNMTDAERRAWVVGELEARLRRYREEV